MRNVRALSAGWRVQGETEGTNNTERRSKNKNMGGTRGIKGAVRNGSRPCELPLLPWSAP
eukprot:5916210-Amphidinium_carterae.1